MQPASTIGPYELRTKLAVGGFCEIWLARQSGPMGFRRWCALKILKEDHRTQDASQRALMAEARLLTRFDHDAIIDIHSFGQDKASGLLYYSMPYISGKTLSTLVERGQKSPYFGVAEALWIGANLLSALDHVHNLRDEQGHKVGIVHRDVSPENVLVTYDGRVKLIDFGIALSHLITRQTQFRRIKGKAQYLAPEQANGVQDLDRRVDIYAAGLVLFFLLTGREAYSSDFMTALSQARNPKLPPISKIADIPNEIATRVQSMLAIDPNRRPSDAGDLSRRLYGLLHKFYPGYNQWSFQDAIRNILVRDHANELDFLAALNVGTQVIRNDDTPPASDLAPPMSKDQNTMELDAHALQESTSPIDALGRTSATVPDIPAFERRQQAQRNQGGNPDKSMEEIFEELENLYNDKS
jgi:serine/threonine-protein kinase